MSVVYIIKIENIFDFVWNVIFGWLFKYGCWVWVLIFFKNVKIRFSLNCYYNIFIVFIVNIRL